VRGLDMIGAPARDVPSVGVGKRARRLSLPRHLDRLPAAKHPL